jgi:hypothetical protein
VTACVRGPGDGAACPVPGIGRANSVDVALLSLLEQQGDFHAIDLARWRPSEPRCGARRGGTALALAFQRCPGPVRVRHRQGARRRAMPHRPAT